MFPLDWPAAFSRPTKPREPMLCQKHGKIIGLYRFINFLWSLTHLHLQQTNPDEDDLTKPMRCMPPFKNVVANSPVRVSCLKSLYKLPFEKDLYFVVGSWKLFPSLFHKTTRFLLSRWTQLKWPVVCKEKQNTAFRLESLWVFSPLYTFSFWAQITMLWLQTGGYQRECAVCDASDPALVSDAWLIIDDYPTFFCKQD